mmetsp:Transcript_11913/g.15585  ORF Transcript_11913/g.15585 Transcript_11913/m.15585 type:complete len:160 (+) Transcript_11913:102-581(+)
MMPRLPYLNILFNVLSTFLIVLSQPEGWRMIDRFHGFRYEISGNVQGVGFRDATKEAAENLGCFGWVQNTDLGTVVGEARCSKKMGPELQAWLKKGPQEAEVTDVHFKDYEDTKIKLHFSHFKILEDERKTCFRDMPHQCEEYQVRDSDEPSEPVHTEL